MEKNIFQHVFVDKKSIYIITDISECELFVKRSTMLKDTLFEILEVQYIMLHSENTFIYNIIMCFY